MRDNTFRTLQAMIRQDPLTDAQLTKIGITKDHTLIDNAEAAKLCGVSEQTMRTLKIPRLRINRYLRYYLSDVLAFCEENTSY